MAFHTPGGGEIQLLAYKRTLEKKGIQVDLFNPWEPNFLDYDVVHYFSCVGGSIHICNFIKTLGIPLVITSSLWVTEESKHLYPVDEIRHQLSMADAIVTNSDAESDELSNVLDLERAKFKTVYNGIDDVFFEEVDGSLFKDKFDIQDDFVLNVGNIESRKNQLNLVKAMHRIPNIKLVLIGHVRDSGYFELVKSSALPSQLIYLGPLESDSELLRAAYKAASVFCLPSTLETPGLAALEAMSLSCPSSVTKIGATREYFGENIANIDPNDIASISDSIINRLNIGNNECVSVEKFRWDTVVDDLIEVYKSVL